jgi:hypothetical protein
MISLFTPCRDARGGATAFEDPNFFAAPFPKGIESLPH